MNIAIVTGATSGLGRAFLEEWAAQAAHFDEVWLVSRHADALERVAAALPWQARCFATRCGCNGRKKGKSIQMYG